jgi:N-acetyl-anhydromuramyl-L-alanine amidase AmpD
MSIVNFKQISQNITTATRRIDYIVIHDTGNRNAGANAEMHYRYFNSANRQASADFFVDSTQILQVNDYNKYFTWHCGDNPNYANRKATNRNSIGIEMCINSDGNYNTMLNNTVWLVSYLMSRLNLNIDSIVRHYDCSGKWCPATMSANAWQNWIAFKRMVNGTLPNIPHDDRNENWSTLKIQMKLNQCYPYKLVEDGIMGSKTQNAIKDFQRRYGLAVDGIVGIQTKSKINDVIAQIRAGK